MRSDFFQRSYAGSIFFNQILDRPDRNTLVLQREEQCIFMAFAWNYVISVFQVINESSFHFFTKVDNSLISTFSAYFYSVNIKINILDVQPHTFRDSDSCSKK